MTLLGAWSSGECWLLTGATGSFGRAFIAHVREHYPWLKLRCLARNEHRMANLKQQYGNGPGMSYFLGDVRDASRLQLAMRGVDIVIHAAALKQVDFGEYDPIEFSTVNIDGTRQVIRTAIEQGVRQVLLISSDKAVQPVNLYGATKMVAERLMVQANSYSQETACNVVRYGNVFGSQGSVLDVYAECTQSGKPLPLTAYDMTRFYLPMHDAVQLACFTLQQPALRGGIVVPVLPAYYQTDLIRAYLGKDAGETLVEGTDITLIGMRPGEKVAECLLTADEARRVASWPDTGDRVSHLLIMPTVCQWAPAFHVPYGWHVGANCWQHQYTSDTWSLRLSLTELRECITAYQGRIHGEPLGTTAAWTPDLHYCGGEQQPRTVL